MASGPIASWQIDGEAVETVTDFIFLGSKITADADCSHEIKILAPWKKSCDKLSILKSRDYFANKGPSSQGYGFSSGHVQMWELNHKESWALKNWCFWAVVLEKILESPLDCKEIKPVNPKGNQSWIFIGRTDAEAEAPILWPPDEKNWLIWKDPDAEKDWRQDGKGTTEDEMVGWHQRLDGHEFEQALGVGDGQGGLACCMTEQLNWIELVTSDVSYLFKHLCNFTLNFRYMARFLFGIAYIAEVTDKLNTDPFESLGLPAETSDGQSPWGHLSQVWADPSTFSIPLCVCQYMNNLGSIGSGGVGNQSRLELSQLMGQQMDSQLLYSIVI